MHGSSRRANTALALAAVLIAWAFGHRAPGSTSCPAPGERRAVAGHSVELACRPTSRRAPVRGPARLLVGLRVDPNRADAATLETLPGIGPARALAIVATRERACFRGVADLERVPGIGPRILAGMAGWIDVGKATEGRDSRSLGPPRPDPVGCAGARESSRREGDS